MGVERYVKRQVERVPSFSLGVVGNTDEVTGVTDVITAGRVAARTQLGTISGQALPFGTRALLLAGGDNDAAQIIGPAPFMSD